ncbi:hypothetical protein ACFX11_026659 [Malus domestica]
MQVTSSSIFLIPYNPTNHWFLTIISQSKDIVYVMNSINNWPLDKDWKNVINTGIKGYNEQTGRQHKVPEWRILQGTPQQKGVVECGYFLMLYMKEIVEDSTLSFHTKFQFASTEKVYTPKDIDSVRYEWATFVYSKLPQDTSSKF